MTADKWNSLTPDQQRVANELLRQAKFEAFENYLDVCHCSLLEKKGEAENVLQSEEHNL